MMALDRTTDMDKHPARSAADIARKKAAQTRQRGKRSTPAQTAAMWKYAMQGSAGLTDAERDVLRPHLAAMGIKVGF